jgi:hypothetical protein
MLAAPFAGGVGIYAFTRSSHTSSSSTATHRLRDRGLAAAIVAAAQIIGGLLVSRVRRFSGAGPTP